MNTYQSQWPQRLASSPRVTLRQDVKTAVTGIRHMNLQLSYALSRFRSVAEDQDFISNSVDFRNPLRFTWTQQPGSDESD